MPRFDVSPAAPHELLPACRLLFNTPDSEQSRECLLSAGAASRLFVARAAGRLCGATLVQVMPGAMGVTCPPHGESAEAQDAVTAAACAWLRERSVKVCQAFAAADEIGAMAPLERYGFRHVTQLVFLRREVDRARDTIAWQPRESPVFLSSYKPGNAKLFAETLVATHEASLDCPELNEARTHADILDGFSQPHPTPEKWYRVLVHEACNPFAKPAAGVLVFDDGPEPDTRGISYLGVVPACRGRGYGDWLIRFAVQTASAAGDALTLSVDVRNTPAMKLYARHGFVAYDRREAWLATWPG